MMDETGFRRFYERTSRPLLSYLRRVTGEKAMADDVFQEAYIRMLQSDFKDPDDTRQRSYLFTTATNLVRDHWRRAKREKRWESEETVPATEPSGGDIIDLRCSVEAALLGLSPQQRSLLWLAYVEGYRHEEIASMLGLRQRSVRVLLYRARQKLSGILTSMGIRKEGM